MKKTILFLLIIGLLIAFIPKSQNKHGSELGLYSPETITMSQLKEYNAGIEVSQVFLKTYNLAIKFLPSNKSLDAENIVKILASTLPYKCTKANKNILLIPNQDGSYTQYKFQTDGSCKIKDACFVTISNNTDKDNYKIDLQVIDSKLATSYNYTLAEQKKLFNAFIEKNKK